LLGEDSSFFLLPTVRAATPWSEWFYPPLFIFSSTFSYFFLVAAHRKKNPVALGFFSSSAAFTFPRTVAWHRFGVLEEHARGFQ
jgi:hypothetical protein